MNTNAFTSLVVIGILLAPSGARVALAQDDATTPDVRYRLQNGDVAELNFPFVPAFNHTITVQPDGYATLHVVGPLRIEGLTVPELTDTLRAKYAPILRDPVLTVTLTEFERPYFIVGGDVQRPGKYDLRGVTTVTQAVAIAGGLNERAQASQAAVFRRRPEGFETKKVDLKKLMKEARLAEDLRLEPGDMLFIPRGRRLPTVAEIASSLWVVSWF